MPIIYYWQLEISRVSLSVYQDWISHPAEEAMRIRFSFSYLISIMDTKVNINTYLKGDTERLFMKYSTQDCLEDSSARRQYQSQERTDLPTLLA